MPLIEVSQSSKRVLIANKIPRAAPKKYFAADSVPARPFQEKQCPLHSAIKIKYFRKQQHHSSSNNGKYVPQFGLEPLLRLSSHRALTTAHL